ncbi:repeat-containing protein [Stenotrophomonas maltophilia]|nr:repeat-containing protein [Stenotrophomonas maltophilia]
MEAFRRHEVAGQRPALPCGDYPSRRLVVPAAGRQMRKRSDVMRLPASDRHCRVGNCRSRWLVVPAAGRQIRKRFDVMGLPASGRHYRVRNCRSRWLVVPAAGRQIRKRSDVVGLPASGRHYRAGNCRSRWLVVPAAGRQIRNRSDVMRLPASGRHYPCGELPKPLVGSAGRWPADTETFRRHGVAGQRPALPVRGVGARRWARGPESGTIASPPPHARSR